LKIRVMISPANRANAVGKSIIIFSAFLYLVPL